jgi:TusA-related sulfurtransferase
MGVEKIDHDLDLRGKVCPYPTLEVRLALNEMAAGEVLESCSTDNSAAYARTWIFV